MDVTIITHIDFCGKVMYTIINEKYVTNLFLRNILYFVYYMERPLTGLFSFYLLLFDFFLYNSHIARSTISLYLVLLEK